MYDNATCEPQKEITLGQIIKDNHEALLEIEAEIDEIGRILFWTNKDELKASNSGDPCSMMIALADDVNTGKRIIEKLNYIINRLR